MLIRTIQTDTLFHPYMICAVQWDTLPQKRRPAPFAQFWNGRKLQM